MSGLSIIDISLNEKELVKFAQYQGINTARDEDMGYAVHAWLKAAFGDMAPKPYRFMMTKRRAKLTDISQLLAYTCHSPSTLKDALDKADPRILAVSSNTDVFACKTMPAQWRQGASYDFETLACPVTRRGKPNGEDKKTDNEKDVFLRAIDRAKALGHDTNQLDRCKVYCDWLVGQMGDCVAINDVKVEGFRRVSMLRKTQKRNEPEKRSQQRLERPLALFTGTLKVANTDEFSALLARGVGRHRAFGCGMILLRPVR